MSVSSNVDDACLTQIRNLRITAPNHRFHSENVKRNACDTHGTDTYLDRIRSVAVQLTGLSPDDLSSYVSFLSRVHGVINAASPAVLFKGVVDMKEYCGGVEETRSKRIRFFLKLVTRTTTDLFILEEMKTYDCEVFRNVARQPFFVQPLRIGDFNVALTEKKRKKRATMKGFMLEDASLPEPRVLFPRAPPCEKNTLAYLADFCNEQNFPHTFFDGIVVMMVPLLHYLDKTWKRSHGDLHWHNIFMTPVEDLYMNREGDTFVLRTEYDTKYSAKNAGLPRIVYGNVKTDKKILLNGIVKVFDWDQSEPYYTKSRAPNPEDDSETYRTTYTNEEGERVTEWVTESVAVHRMYRDKLAFFRCLKSRAREYYHDIIGKMVVNNPSEIVNFDYFLDNSAGFMGATDENGELLRDEDGDELPVTQVRLNGQNARPKEIYASALESGDGNTLVMQFVSFEDPKDPEADEVDRYHVESIGDDMFYVNRENPCVLELRDDVIRLHDLPPERFEGRFADGTSRLQRDLVKEWAKENRNARDVNFEVNGQFYTLLNQYTINDENMVRFGSQGARILCTSITLSTIDFMLEQFHIQAVTNILDAAVDGTLTFPIASTDGHPKPKMQKAQNRTVDSKQLTTRVNRSLYAEEVRRPQQRRMSRSPSHSSASGARSREEDAADDHGERSDSDATQNAEEEVTMSGLRRRQHFLQRLIEQYSPRSNMQGAADTLRRELEFMSPDSTDSDSDSEATRSLNGAGGSGSPGDRDARGSFGTPPPRSPEREDPLTAEKERFVELFQKGLSDDDDVDRLITWLQESTVIKKDLKLKKKTAFDEEYIKMVDDKETMDKILVRTLNFVKRKQDLTPLSDIANSMGMGGFSDDSFRGAGLPRKLLFSISDVLNMYPFSLKEYGAEKKMEEKLKTFFRQDAERVVGYLREDSEELDRLPPESKRQILSLVSQWIDQEMRSSFFRRYA